MRMPAAVVMRPANTNAVWRSDDSRSNGSSARDRVARDHDVVPAQGGAGGGVVHAVVGDGAADHERVDGPEPQLVVEWRPVEGVVARFAQDDVVCGRREFVDDVPAPAALPGVLGPDPPLGVAGSVGVLAVDDGQLVLAGAVE